MTFIDRTYVRIVAERCVTHNVDDESSEDFSASGRSRNSGRTHSFREEGPRDFGELDIAVLRAGEASRIDRNESAR